MLRNFLPLFCEFLHISRVLMFVVCYNTCYLPQVYIDLELAVLSVINQISSAYRRWIIVCCIVILFTTTFGTFLFRPIVLLLHHLHVLLLVLISKYCFYLSGASVTIIFKAIVFTFIISLILHLQLNWTHSVYNTLLKR